MTANLPPQLLKYFTPRPPLPFVGHLDRDFKDRKRLQLSSVIPFTNQEFDQDYVPKETIFARRLRKKKEREEKSVNLISSRKKNWDPISDPNLVGSDPYRTLFVARLSYDTDENELKSLFGYYGPITKISLVTDKGSGKSRGYAFLEFERESDLRAAQREMDGYKLRGRRIVVDVERGRTVSGWIPRKLGGGIGGTRAPGVKPVKRDTEPIRNGEPYRKMDRREYSSKGYGRQSFDRGDSSRRSFDRDDSKRRDRGDRRPYDRGDRHDRYDRGDRNDRRSSDRGDQSYSSRMSGRDRGSDSRDGESRDRYNAPPPRFEF